MRSTCCVDATMGADVRRTAELMKVVAEENRLKILCTLRQGERCVCDIWQDLGLPQNLASHHLKVLKDAGLIVSHKEGLRVHYAIDKRAMSVFNALLSNFLRTYE